MFSVDCFKLTALEEQIGLDEAIELYEMNISNSIDENDEFTRLAEIYGHQDRSEDQIRVLRAGIAFYESLIFSRKVMSKLPTLNSLTAKLRKVRHLAPC